MLAASDKTTEPKQDKTKPKKFIPLGTRGFVDDEPMEFIIICHNCGSDWIIKKGMHQYKPDLQMLKCNNCGRNFDIDSWVRNEIEKVEELTLALPLSDLMNYSAKRMAKRLGLHPSTYAKYEHIIWKAIVGQLAEIVSALNAMY